MPFKVRLFMLLVGLMVVIGTPSAFSQDSPQVVESNDAVVVRQGNWATTLDLQASGGSYLVAGAPDAVLSLEFEGTSIEIIYLSGPGLGSVAFEVDGAVLRTFNTATEALQFNQRNRIDYLDEGRHVLRVYPAEGVIAIDAFVASVPPDPELLTGVASEGRTRVVVGLAAPFEPEGYLPDANAVQRQRTSIAQARQNLVTALTPYTHRVVANSQNWSIPFIALEVDEAGLEFLQNSPLVTSVQEDRLVPVLLDSSTPVVDAPEAWALGYEGQNVAVAVLDTGVEATHSFFGDRVIAEACFSSSAYEQTGICPSGEDTQFGPGAASPALCEGALGCDHGTHVSGIVGGDGGSFDGVARGTDIVGVQVFSLADEFTCLIYYGVSDCVLSLFIDQLAGLDWVYANRDVYNIVAVNLSLGGGQYFSPCDDDDPAYTAAVDQLYAGGVAVIAASGNSGLTDSMGSPACIDSVISVGATQDNDTVAYFSNNASFLDLYAPGVDITSSVPGGGFDVMDGTSQASPHVAGAWAILASAAPDATIDEILTAFKNTGVDIADTRTGGQYTHPRIDIDDALAEFPVPGPITQTAPQGTVLDDDTPVFEWLPPTGNPDGFYLTIYSGGEEVQSLDVSPVCGTTCNHVLETPLVNDDYQWFVQGYNTNGRGMLSGPMDFTILVQNDPPIADDDIAQTDVDTPVSINLTGNDFDADGSIDVTTVVIVQQPANGDVVDNDDGTVTYTPDPGFWGFDTFTYTVDDDGGLTSNEATVSVQVGDDTEPPVLLSAVPPADSYIYFSEIYVDAEYEDTGSGVKLIEREVYYDGDWHALGTFFFDASGIADQVLSFRFRATDFFDNQSDWHEVTNVTLDRTPPESYAYVESAFSLPKVYVYWTGQDAGVGLVNFDVQFRIDGGDWQDWHTATTKRGDTLFGGEGQTFDFRTRARDYLGHVEDYPATPDATVTIAITHVTGTVYDTDGSTPLQGIIVASDRSPLTFACTDASGQFDLWVAADDGPFKVSAGGYGDACGGGAYPFQWYDGVTDYAQAAQFTAVQGTIDAVDFTMTEQTETAPVANDDNASTTVNTSVEIFVLQNDVDPEGDIDPGSVVVTDPPNGNAYAMLDGTVWYTPDQDFTGQDTFTYTVEDRTDLMSNEATVTVFVGDDTEPPMLVSAVPPADSFINFSEIYVDAEYEDTGSGVKLIEREVYYDSGWHALGTFFFDASGIADQVLSFRFRATDHADNTSDWHEVTNITLDRTPPESYAYVDSSVSLPEVYVYWTGQDVGAGLVDFDVQRRVNGGDWEDWITATQTWGTTFVGTEGDTYDFRTRARDYLGHVEEYPATPDATVTISITRAQGIIYDSDGSTPLENVIVALDRSPLTWTCTDANGQFTLMLPADGGQFTVSAGGYGDPCGGGSYPFQWYGGVTDYNQATFLTAIEGAQTGLDFTMIDNVAPVANDDSAETNEDNAVTISVLANDTDSDGTLDTSSVTVKTQPSDGGAVANANGTITYTPDSGFAGQDTFTYTVKDDDGAESNSANVTVYVNALPVANDDSATVTAGESVNINLTSNDTDSDGSIDVTSITIVGPPAHGSLVDNDNGTVRFTADSGYSGTDNFTYRVRDNKGALSNLATVTITISAPANRRPVANNDSYSVDQGGALSINAPGVLSNDSDADGDTLTAVLSTGVSHGVLNLNPDGSFTYNPDSNYLGTDSFTYYADDGEVTSSSPATVTITVQTPGSGDDGGSGDGGGAGSGVFATVTASVGLNFREAPYIGAAKIRLLAYGSTYQAVARTADATWAQLNVEGTLGWSHTDWLTFAGDFMSLPVGDGSGGGAIAPPIPIEGGILAYPTAHMKVRGGPGFQYPRIDGVAWGQEVLVVGQSQDGLWLFIQYALNRSGWSYKSYYLDAATGGPLPANLAMYDATTPTTFIEGGAYPLGNMNVRSGPGLQYPAIAGVGWGQTVRVVGQSLDGRWIMVEYATGHFGWSYKSWYRDAATGLPLLGNLPIVQ